MQTRSFLYLCSLLSASYLVSAQTSYFIEEASSTIRVDGAQFTHIIQDLSAYLGSLTTQPAYYSVSSVLATAVPSSVLAQASLDPHAVAQMLMTSTPSWYAALPSDVKAYASSVAAAEASIVAKDSGTQRSRAAGMVGAALVASVAGILML